MTEQDLNDAVDARLERLKELATLRSQARRAQRERLDRRRSFGLAKRHKTKLDRINERNGMTEIENDVGPRGERLMAELRQAMAELRTAVQRRRGVHEATDRARGLMDQLQAEMDGTAERTAISVPWGGPDEIMRITA